MSVAIMNNIFCNFFLFFWYFEKPQYFFFLNSLFAFTVILVF